MFNTTVTVFNLYKSEQMGTATWYPHVVSNCYFNADKSANIAKTGLENADSAKLHIPYKMDNGNVMIGELQYLPPKEWDAQTNDKYEATITFADGEDFFIVGEFTEKPIDDSLYRGGLFGYLNRIQDHVYRITNVGKYDVIPHFEIGGA